MRIGEPPVIRKPIPLTPLIDVVFLLLMFFMLSSTFAKFGTFGNGAAQAENQAGTGEGQWAIALIVASGPGDVSVNGLAVPRAQLASELDRLFAAGARRAAVRATRAASVQDFVAVLDIARQSRLADLVVAP